ncbi:hypothetical protein P280DRAFT_464662 [Massarina eburnea CBS 473.64]|uniref:Ribosomal protein S35, mitochondrial n=1 Tax=Massarina eburnea CBS 473.64 TaxID=1395130 RepID=A0A6A6SF89_9PLEO|nr:hypothetical protein P280DRAFT_464662 [Massarina eburnea CBS 473.64]
MPPRLRTSNFPSAVTCPSIRPTSVSQPAQKAREFSQSSCRQVTLRRRNFYAWLNGPGRALKQPIPNSTNYLGAYDKYGNLVRASPGWQVRQKEAQKNATSDVGSEATGTDGDAAPVVGQEADEPDMAARRLEEEAQAAGKKDEDDRLPPETTEDLRPFPLNRFFRSQAVLSEELREAIYQYMVDPVESRSVPGTSSYFGVSNERVGAVLRLKQMEKEWIAQGKTLAIPYSKAVLAMLPTTPHVGDGPNKRPMIHEPINDLIVHPATRQQLFVPVAESRQFTRVDAGKAFDNDLLPADERIPHPEMVNVERDMVNGYGAEERLERAKERMMTRLTAKAEKEDAQKKAEKEALTRVPKRRWDFVVQDISVESVGRNGRDHRGVGWRYGLPHQDRKKGQVKIPTSVEA